MKTTLSIAIALVATLSLCCQAVQAQHSTIRFPNQGPSNFRVQAYGGSQMEASGSNYRVSAIPNGMAPEQLPMDEIVSENPGYSFAMDSYQAPAESVVAPTSYGYEMDGYEMDSPDGACGVKDDCGKGAACAPTYHLRVFADFLYLRPRNADVAYGVISNLDVPTSILPPVQRSPFGQVDPDYSAGFRLGFGFCLSQCDELEISYTMFESNTNDTLQRDPNDNTLELFPMTIHPATENAVIGTVDAAASLDINYDLIDVTYRRAIRRTMQTDVFAEIGIRYGQMEQGFHARYTDDLASSTNDAQVFSDIDFSGVGLSLGLDVDHYSCRWPVMFYMKGMTSLLAGEFNATYQQYIQNNSYPGVNTEWEAGRIVPTFDLEVGTGFYLPRGTLRATVGYAYSAWANVAKTEDWIHAVQTNDVRDMSSTMSFDGLVFRLEGRF